MRREALHSPDRAFCSGTVPHAFGRLALQVSPAPKGAAESPRVRMGSMVASSILTPREGTPGVRDALDATDAPDVRWFLAQTPEDRRVPRAQSERHRWMRGLNVKAERESLDRMSAVQKRANLWPCDVCPARSMPGCMMGSLKVLEAKQQSVEVQRLVQAEQLEVATARAYAAAHDTQEVVDTVESLMQLGLTEFEASMEQFQRAEDRLGRMRSNAPARPPDLNYHPEVTEAHFGLLRDRYYYHRGKEMTELLKVIGVDRSDQTFANGGPVTNRQKQDPLQGLDFELDVVGLPDSPVGFSVLKFRKERNVPDQHQQANIPVFDSSDAHREKDTMVDEKPQSDERDESSSKPGAPYANRDSFRKKSLWIMTEEDPKSRAATGYSTQLPRHEKEVRREENVPLPAQSGLTADRQRNPLRKDARFMASSPVNASSSIKPKCSQKGFERTGLFMTASYKYAPDSKLLQKQSKHDKGITIKSLAKVLNNTV